jgi:antitoxin VapB
VPHTQKTRVFMSGRSQHVTIPREYRFRGSEVSIRQDPATGDIILSEGPGSWDEIFVALDAAQIPDEFLSESERDMRPPDVRPAVEEMFDDDHAPNTEA